jgi:hypothetical protein
VAGFRFANHVAVFSLSFELTTFVVATFVAAPFGVAFVVAFVVATLRGDLIVVGVRLFKPSRSWLWVVIIVPTISG